MKSILHRRMTSRPTARLHVVFTAQPLLVYTPPIDVTLPHPVSVSPCPFPGQTRPSCRSTPLLSTQLHWRPDPHLPGVSPGQLGSLQPPIQNLRPNGLSRQFNTRGLTVVGRSPVSGTFRLYCLSDLSVDLAAGFDCSAFQRYGDLGSCSAPTDLRIEYTHIDVNIFHLHIKLRHRIESMMLSFWIQTQAPSCWYPCSSHAHRPTDVQ